MAIKTEIRDSKKFYTVYVDGTDAKGKRVQLRRRGILSKREAESVEFELRQKIAALREETPSLTWDLYFRTSKSGRAGCRLRSFEASARGSELPP